MTDRPASWFTDWLVKQKKYSPQPYRQCARVLREAGQSEKANAVLFANTDRERDEPDGRYGRWLFLNRLIPLVDLHPSFKIATDLGLGPSAWFMFQTLCGWFLAALIIAGLAGVGKPGGRD